ncbi:MAG TPA: DUF4124 domain-containing protein [Cellvibrio sp.]|nr:DUF4124 domain-containing protein [Cellvibrio sp.]
MRVYLIVLLSVLSLSIQAEIYKTTDKNGRIIYTDQPAANDTKAEVVKLPSINQLPVPDANSIPAENSSPAIPKIAYKLVLTQPAPGIRLQANERTLAVSVSADQALMPGHFYAYFLDGEKVKESTASSITLEELPRGEHNVYVEVRDEFGKRFGQSNSVSFSAFRPIVKH